MGNKGGVSIKFRLFETTLCFLSVHFAAHETAGALRRRNKNYREVLKRSHFEKCVPSPSLADFLRNKSNTKSYPSPYRRLTREEEKEQHGAAVAPLPKSTLYKNSIVDNDVIIFMGDLNYRLADMSVEDVLHKIQVKDFGALGRSDQLFQMMEREVLFQNDIAKPNDLKISPLLNTEKPSKIPAALGKSRYKAKYYNGFQEESINFPPSYKFVKGSDIYTAQKLGKDGKKKKKKVRKPSYTDRILFMDGVDYHRERRERERLRKEYCVMDRYCYYYYFYYYYFFIYLFFFLVNLFFKFFFFFFF
jgi:hypothetical protein